MKKEKIVVIGSSNIDLIMKMDHLPEKGETVTDAVFMQVYGGKGANQAVGAARAGGQVAFISCVGEDAYTPKMLENFRTDGMDISFVFTDPELPSGHALIMIGGEGQNIISVAPGANYSLTPEKIDQAEPVIRDAAIIIMQYEIPGETIQHVLDYASINQIPVLLNFAPARSFDLSYLSKLSILVVNEIEAGYLADMPVSSAGDAEKAAEILRQKGVGTVIITLGVNGAFLLSESDKAHIPAFSVDAVDATAAGDVYCGSFAVAYVEGKSLAESILFASAAAAICVTRMGAQPSAPTREEIDRFLQQQ